MWRRVSADTRRAPSDERGTGAGCTDALPANHEVKNAADAPPEAGS